MYITVRNFKKISILGLCDYFVQILKFKAKTHVETETRKPIIFHNNIIIILYIYNNNNIF